MCALVDLELSSAITKLLSLEEEPVMVGRIEEVAAGFGAIVKGDLGARGPVICTQSRGVVCSEVDG